MATGPYSWSLTASDNGSADSAVNFAEGQQPASLNNSARALMAGLAGWLDSIGGNATYGGSSNAYTITNPAVAAWAAYGTGNLIALKANHTNSGAATLNVDGLGAKSIVTADGGALVSGDLVSGGIYLLAYDGTNFQVLNTIAGGSYQPLDATLTALAALSYTSGELFPTLTAADTFALRTVTSAGLALLDDADASAQRTTLGLGTSATVNTGTSGATIPLLNGGNTWSAAQTFSTAGAPVAFRNTTDAGTNAAAIFESDRATPTVNDVVNLLFRVSDAAGTQTEVARINAVGTNITAGSVDGRLAFATTVSGSTTTQLQLSSTSATFVPPILAPAGSVSAPALSFSSDTDNGFYYGGTANTVRYAAGGALLFQMYAGALDLVSGQFVVPNGSAAAPAIAGRNDLNTGLYFSGSDILYASVGGTARLTLSTTSAEIDVPVTARILDSSETSGSLTSASRNRRVVCSGGVTLPSSGMTSGDFILIDPAGTARTITRPAAHTMYVRDTDVASDDSYAHQIVVAIFHGSSKYTLHGLP